MFVNANKPALRLQKHTEALVTLQGPAWDCTLHVFCTGANGASNWVFQAAQLPEAKVDSSGRSGI